MRHLEEIKKYWETRAEGYSMKNMDELHTDSRMEWVNKIHQYAPKGDCLNVLDVGCGPGFFSIIMSQCGHRVTAVDYTDAMLEHAQKNAQEMGQKGISFLRMDAQNLDFEDNTFDLVISRNLTWDLEFPEQAYSEWVRVLRPGGKIVNFDANHYLHLYDKDYRKFTTDFYDKSHDEKYMMNADPNVMNRIAEDLPLSRQQRPRWDCETFVRLGITKVEVDILERLKPADETEGNGLIRSFLISAEK